MYENDLNIVRILQEDNGIVYLVLNITRGEEVIVKKAPDSWASSGSPDIEYKILKHLTENNSIYSPKFYSITEVEEYGEIRYYTEMEYIYGQELDKIGYSKNLRADFIWVLLGHALRGLVFMHNLGVIHNDLHASNMIWTGNRLVFIDFGESHIGGDPYKFSDDIKALMGTFEELYIKTDMSKYQTKLDRILDITRTRRIRIFTQDILDIYNE